MYWSPLEQFEIKPLLQLNSLYTLSLTNYVIYIVLVGSIIYGYSAIIGPKVVSSRWSLAIETINDTISNLTQREGAYLPLLFTTFNVILVANLISMIPYSMAITAQLVLIISWSLTLWIGNVLIGLRLHRLEYFGLFVPTGTPLALVPVLVVIETLSYSSRAISLGLRLSANILSGHLLMVILGGLILSLMSTSTAGLVGGIIPITGVVAIVCLEFGISVIQAYVFSILLIGYIRDSVNLH